MDLLERLRRGLEATRSAFRHRLVNEQGGITPESLEEALIAADAGIEVAEAFAGQFERARSRGDLGEGGGKGWLLAQVGRLLTFPAQSESSEKPHVVLVIGVNGTGKTTTAAKIAAAERRDGRRVTLVAADTFRAAAIEQLQEWGARLDVPVVAQKVGADPAAVVFDALQAALARGVDSVIVDTAGRLHTKHNLMAELEKVRKVCARAVPGAPHEVLLVLDSTTGGNGLAQAREFRTRVGVTGVVLTKLDGTAKGGIVLAVAKELGVPVRWIGVGEGVDDLLPFQAEAFATALLEGLA